MSKLRLFVLEALCLFSRSLTGDYLHIANNSKYQCGKWGCSKVFIDVKGNFCINYLGKKHLPAMSPTQLGPRTADRIPVKRALEVCFGRRLLGWD